jgi:hypothetical protein
MKSSASKTATADSKGIRGPKPEVLNLKGNWKQAIKNSFLKTRPKQGWPKP